MLFNSNIYSVRALKAIDFVDQEKQKQVGRLTPANISRELSADVTYPEHIYHWLKKQHDENFPPRFVFFCHINKGQCGILGW